MPWTPIEVDEKDASAFAREFAKTSKFLVDDSLGRGTTELLREAGWNVKDVSEVGFSGRSDEDIYSLAHKENRILLTHDHDFLDDRRFPPHRNPGVVILPGATGSVRVLIKALGEMLSVVGKFREVWRKTKIVFSENGNMTLIRRNRETGAMEKSVCCFPKHGPPMVWVDDEEGR